MPDESVKDHFRTSHCTRRVQKISPCAEFNIITNIDYVATNKTTIRFFQRTLQLVWHHY